MKPTDSITTNAHGFVLHRGPHRWPVAWKAIIGAVAFKRDELTVDTVCLDLSLADGTSFLLSEDCAGWIPFLESLAQEVPGFPAWTTWLPGVTTPAFAPNVTQVFGAPGTAPNQRL